MNEMKTYFLEEHFSASQYFFSYLSNFTKERELGKNSHFWGEGVGGGRGDVLTGRL